MTIDFRGNNRWRIRKMIDRKVYQITVGYKPSRKQAELLLQDYINKECRGLNKTFEECAKEYLDARTNVLAPATLKNYRSSINKISEYHRKVEMSKIDNQFLQECINDYLGDHKVSSARKLKLFICEVVYSYTDKRLRATLPKDYEEEKYVPSLEEVKKIIDFTKGTKIGTLFLLCCYGLRVGEALAMTPNDIEDGRLNVTKSLSLNIDKGHLIKVPKTPNSVRYVPVPKEVTDELKKCDFKWQSYDKYREQLYFIEEKLGINKFGFHRCRHFYASYCLNELGLSYKYVQKYGGWSNKTTIDEYYNHTLNDKTIQIPLL